MSRLPRICVPDCPHHVTARGNRREPIFFEDGDQDIYCDMLAGQMRKANVEVWAQRIKQTTQGPRCARRSRPGDHSDRLTLSKGSNAFSNAASRDARRDGNQPRKRKIRRPCCNQFGEHWSCHWISVTGFLHFS